MWEMVKDDAYSKCWIDLSDVVKGKRNGKECNDWKNSIGCKIGVRYKWKNDDVEERLFEIIDYNKGIRKLTLKWNENKYLVNTDQLHRGSCGCIFDKFTSKFKYEIGQVINGLTIIERYYKKGQQYGQQYKWYKYRCKKGHVHEIEESHLKKGTACSICHNRTVLKGYNDLSTIRPDLIQYFLNPDHAKEYTSNSGEKVTLKCPLCGKEKTMPIYHLTNRGFSCSNCSDGVSIPEKYMSNILHSVNCNFKHQITRVDFEWISKYKYDFYLTDYDIIIETHGKQHYKDRSKNSNWNKLEDIQSNDTNKLKLTQQNGYELNKNYFVIDCRNSDFEFLTERIKRTLDTIGELYNIDFSNVNYKDCYIKSQTNIFYIVTDITKNNPELNYQQIADKLKEEYGYQICPRTVATYLKRLNEIDSTNYPSKKKKVIICLNTGVIYESIMEAERQTGVSNKSISACCLSKSKGKSAGIIDGKPAFWLYYSDYEKLSEEEVNKIKNQELPSSSKAVICITTGNIYESIMEAERQTGVSGSHISECCRGKRNSAGKDEYGNKLKWKYLDEYLESK